MIGPQPDPRVRRGIYDASEARAARLKRVSAILRSTEPLSLSLSLSCLRHRLPFFLRSKRTGPGSPVDVGCGRAVGRHTMRLEYQT